MCNYSEKYNDSAFIHSEFTHYSDSINYKKSCDFILNTNRVDTNKRFMEPYAVFSNGSSPILFNSEVNCNGETISLNSIKIAGIYTYKDNEMMENIAIPLLNPIGNTTITNGKNGALFGCYLPYSLALQLVDSFGFSTIQELFDSNVVIRLYHEKTYYDISINNIYINVDNTEIDLNEYNKTFNRYYDFFQRYNDNAIFVDCYSFSRVCKTTIFCCDFITGFDRSRALVSRILGGTFSDRGCSISFYVGQNILFPNNVNKFCVEQRYENTFVGVLSLVLFIISVLLYLAFLYYIYRFDYNRMLRLRFCLLFAVSMPISIWFLSALLSAISLPTQAFSLSVINYMSNIFLLLSMLSLCALILLVVILSRKKYYE